MVIEDFEEDSEAEGSGGEDEHQGTSGQEAGSGQEDSG